MSLLFGHSLNTSLYSSFSYDAIVGVEFLEIHNSKDMSWGRDGVWICEFESILLY